MSGLYMYRHYLEITDPEEQERIRRDALERANFVIDALRHL